MVWDCCCTLRTRLSWTSLLLITASTCTSTTIIPRYASAHRPGMLRQQSELSQHVLLTSRPACRPASFDLTPPRPRWCRLGLPQQVAKVNVSQVLLATSWINVSEMAPLAHDLGVVIDSQLTMSAQVDWPQYVEVDTTSYGSYDHSSDLCHPSPWRCSMFICRQ